MNVFDEFYGNLDCDPMNVSDLPQSEQDEYQQWACQIDEARNQEESEMSIQEMYPSKSSHLKAADLNGKQVKAVIEGNEIAEFNEGNKLVLKFKGKEKGLVLNKTNASILASYFGDDENTWNGKEIVIYPDKTTFGSDIVDCLRVRVEADNSFDDDPGF